MGRQILHSFAWGASEARDFQHLAKIRPTRGRKELTEAAFKRYEGLVPTPESLC